MLDFQYAAATHAGKLDKGYIRAESKASAVEALKSRGLIVLHLGEVRLRRPTTMQAFLRYGHVTMADRVIFAKQLAVMVRAGLDMGEALGVLSEQASTKSMTKILQGVNHYVREGRSLAAAMSFFPTAFSDLAINMVRAGEAGGTLEESLERLADQLQRDANLKKKIRDALIYPSIILLLAAGIGMGLGLFVLPRLVEFFESFGGNLPLPTRILIVGSKFFQRFGLYLPVALVGFLIVLRVVLRSKPVRPYWHRLVLSLPIFGKMVRSYNLARFSRTLATLLKSGLPIVDAMRITSLSLENEMYRRQVQVLTEVAQKGVPLAEILKRHGNWMKFFPPFISRMASVGERTGKLENILFFIAEYYEDEVETFTRNLTTIIEPVLLIGMGVFVGGLLLSILYPVYQLIGNLSG